MPRKATTAKAPKAPAVHKAPKVPKAPAKKTAKLDPETGAHQAPASDPDGDATRLYLRKIGRKPLLKHEQVVELAKAIEVAQLALDQAEPGTSRYQYLQHEYNARRNELAVGNLRLVVSIAKRFLPSGLPLDELIQEGNLGLLRAAEKFDWRKGFRFSTYATWWIQQQIMRAIPEQQRHIHLPAHIAEEITKLQRATRRMTDELGHEPTDLELCRELSWKPEHLEEVRIWAMPFTSLDLPVAGGDEGELITLGATLATPDEQPERANFTELLSFMRVVGLDPRTRMVLLLRYGLLDGRERTLEEVGKECCVTRERIRQIEKKGLGLLRDHAQELREYLHSETAKGTNGGNLIRLFGERAVNRMQTTRKVATA